MALYIPAQFNPLPRMLSPYGAAKLHFLTNETIPKVPNLEESVNTFAWELASGRQNMDDVVETAVQQVYAYSWRGANRYLSFPTDREDCVQNAVMKSVAKSPHFQPYSPDYVGDFKAYVFRAIKSECITSVRRARLRASAGSPPRWLAEEKALNALNQIPDELYWSGRVAYYVELLTPAQQEVAGMRFFNDMPYKAIASVLGKTENTVKVLMSKAVDTLAIAHEVLQDTDITALSLEKAYLMVQRYRRMQLFRQNV